MKISFLPTIILVSTQKDNVSCGVYVCQYALGMMNLINRMDVRTSQLTGDLKALFITLCEDETSEFIVKENEIDEMRQNILKLICSLSNIWNPSRPPAPYIGIFNPKDRCYANVVIQCVMRCTPIMENIVKLKDSERPAYAKLLFQVCMEMKSMCNTFTKPKGKIKHFIQLPKEETFDKEFPFDLRQGKLYVYFLHHVMSHITINKLHFWDAYAQMYLNSSANISYVLIKLSMALTY